ncbi:MAG: hypothetical protein RL632_1655 [Bacteroidota bacterium]|jgi:hypothetical protein
MNKQKKGFSLFRSKVDDATYEHDAELNRNLDRFSMKIIKVVSVVGIAIGIVLLVSFWYWVIKMLYKIG